MQRDIARGKKKGKNGRNVETLTLLEETELKALMGSRWRRERERETKPFWPINFAVEAFIHPKQPFASKLVALVSYYLFIYFRNKKFIYLFGNKNCFFFNILTWRFYRNKFRTPTQWVHGQGQGSFIIYFLIFLFNCYYCMLKFILFKGKWREKIQ